ncbi:MAG TPA: FAD-dependent oxidoreductase [Nitrospiraceae bacterium]|nr:FAD-dependent oxidoreductase [Nitrospiraceae bacterium]
MGATSSGIMRQGAGARLANRDKIVILGAGLQGVCAALAAAQKGHAVTLIEQDHTCLNRASLRNEGKIHLGHVYAHDRSFQTADLMLRCALSFAPLLDSWCPGQFAWPALRSNPFLYVIARDSLESEDQLHEHYARIEARCHELQLSEPGLHYLGEELLRVWTACDLPRSLNPRFATAAISTPEASIDLARLQNILAGVLAQTPRVELLYGHLVEEIARRPHGVTVSGHTRTGERGQVEGTCVVNALWEGRLAIDDQLGLAPRRPWVFRLKHRVLTRTPSALIGLPSMTFVLGPFGDVVTSPRDRSLYLSWYPVCQTGWSQSLKPPATWEAAATGMLDARDQEPIVQDTLRAFDQVIPGLANAEDATADGGVIFAWGNSDIDDGGSELHQRHQIGITSAEGYYSINTGKLTSAPYFARQLLELLP